MKFRKPLKIKSRTSSVTNVFVQAIVPYVEPSDAEVEEALGILGLTRENFFCVYCGDKSTDWDHLRPLVKDKRPTGYITEIRNMVPACGRCNQSKGGKEWRSWIIGPAKNSPHTRGIPDLSKRIEYLEGFERWGNVKPLDFRAIVGDEFWDAHWHRLEEILSLLHDAQQQVDVLKDR